MRTQNDDHRGRTDDHDRQTTIESPLAHLTDEQIEELGSEFDAIHDEVFERPRRPRRDYIRVDDRVAPPPLVLGRVVLLASRYKPAVAPRDRRAVAGQDPREHGDRPQRHARPVGLDERPGHPLLDLGLGHGLDRRGVEALPQLRPPHLHEHPRQGQGPRLRDHADRPAPEVAPGLPRAAASTTCCWPRSSSGASPSTTSTSRRSSTGKKPKEQIRRELKGIGAQGAPPRSSRTTSPCRSSPALAAGAVEAQRVGEPLRRERKWEDAAATALKRGCKTFRTTLKANFTANIVRNVWAYAIIFCGHFPDQTYTFSQEEVEDECRGGWYVRQLLGAANIEGSRSSTFQRQPRLPGRAPSLPGHAEHPLRRDRPARQGDLRALRAARTTPARSASSWAWCSARSCGSRSPAASRGPSPAPTWARRRRRSEPKRTRASAEGSADRLERLGPGAGRRRGARGDAGLGLALQRSAESSATRLACSSPHAGIPRGAPACPAPPCRRPPR